MQELVVTGTFCLPDRIWTGWLSIQHGTITQLGTGKPPPSHDLLSFPIGTLLLPGLVDPHVHFREPGLTHKEDLGTGTAAAVAGGVTTVLDMPNTSPPAANMTTLTAKTVAATGRCWSDFGFHLLYTGNNLSELVAVDPARYASVKLFMAGHATAPYVVSDPDAIRPLLQALSGRAIVTVHAEDGRLIGSEGQSAHQYAASRAPEIAAGAIAVLVGLVRQTRCHVHVLHVSSQAELGVLHAARQEGLPITWEFIHPHLSFVASDFEQYGPRFKLSPPLRNSEDQSAIWAALLGGLVDCLGSDHAPHTVAEKSQPLAQAPAGLPGVQESLPAVFTGLRQRGVELSDAGQIIARLMAAAPARLFRLVNKGQLLPGRDADIVAFDPDVVWTPQPDMLQSRCGWSPYEGRQLQGAVRATILRGEVVYMDGRLQGQPRGLPVFERLNEGRGERRGL